MKSHIKSVISRTFIELALLNLHKSGLVYVNKANIMCLIFFNNLTDGVNRFFEFSYPEPYILMHLFIIINSDAYHTVFMLY